LNFSSCRHFHLFQNVFSYIATTGYNNYGSGGGGGYGGNYGKYNNYQSRNQNQH
jgi:hypothetical protein